MMTFVKYMIKRIISLLMHIFWIFPVKKNKVIFINDHSYTYSDNLRYLAEYFVEKSPEKYDIWFSLKKARGLKDRRIKPVRFLSLEHFYHIMTSAVVFTNNSGIVYLPMRKSQLVINTWHGGGPYKVTGISALDTYWYRRDLRYNASKTDYILSDSRVFSEVEAKGMFYSRRQCVSCGMPRMDLFFDKEAAAKARKKVFKAYRLPEDTKLVLYAPTFRGLFEDYKGAVADGMLEIDHISVTEALTEKYGGNWLFALRLHPRLTDIKIECSGLINMTSHPDAQELLLAADALITDYSSVIWDFSFTGRPCFVFATDIDDYEVKRGFYLPPEEWPYPIASTNEQMRKNILGFDPEDYAAKVREHHKAVGSYEKGHSREAVKRIVDKHIEKR